MQEEIAIRKGITIPTVCLAHKRSIKFQSDRRHAQGATSSWKALVTLVERGVRRLKEVAVKLRYLVSEISILAIFVTVLRRVCF